MQTITLTNETRRCIVPNVFLGYEGENNANKLVFEFTDGFIDGLAVLKVERGEQKGTIELEKFDETYELEVKSSLVSVKGDITFQCVITQSNGTIIKYDPFVMTVKDAIDTDAELPEQYPSWQEIIATELAKVEEAITNAEEATKKANETSEQLLEDKENGVFNGKDGISPSAKVESTSSGAIITVTDSVGTTTATITNGRDGTDGTDGKDGVSPTIKTEQVEGGTKIIITDVDGTNSVTLSNGKNGTNGKDGISPIATVTQITNGATVSITDVNGTTTATIYNGKDGIFEETDPIYIADKPNIALKSELPTKVSELENDSEFINKTVNNLTNYYVKTETYTKSEVDNLIPKVPTKVSELENDSGYLTEETDPTVPSHVKGITESDITNWNNKSEFSGDYNDLENKPIIPSTEGMVTTEQLTQELSKKQDTLTAGDNITIENNVISAIGGSSEASGNPTGTIISFMGLTAPTGYLVCDGSILNIADYPTLANHFETQFGSKNYFGGDGETTFALPDLRNEFLRGYHYGGDEQLSGEVGIHQDATVIPRILLNNSASTLNYYGDSGTTININNVDKDISTSTLGHKISSSSYTASGASTTAYTVRPTNIAVLFCIKY